MRCARVVCQEIADGPSRVRRRQERAHRAELKIAPDLLALGGFALLDRETVNRKKRPRDHACADGGRRLSPHLAGACSKIASRTTSRVRARFGTSSRLACSSRSALLLWWTRAMRTRSEWPIGLFQTITAI